MGLFHIFRAFRERAAAWYLSGHLFNNAGDWMHMVALEWLIYRLTGSAFYLGTIAFFSYIPIFLLTAVTGPLVDRFTPLRMVTWTQTALTGFELVLAGVTALGWISPSILIVFALLRGVLLAFALPARHALLNTVSSPAMLPSAVAMFMGAGELTQFIAPPIVAALISRRTTGEGVPPELIGFLLGALCFGLHALCMFKLSKLNFVQASAKKIHEPFLGQLRSGLTFVMQDRHARRVIPIIALAALVGYPYVDVLPALVRQLVGTAQPRSFGWLHMAVGLGGLVGAWGIGALAQAQRALRWFSIGLTLFGLGLLGIGCAPTVWLSCGAAFVAGCGAITLSTSANAILLGLTPPGFRGRVMAVYTLALGGLLPIGALMFGAVTEYLGARTAMLFAGMALCMVAIFHTLSYSSFPRRRESSMLNLSGFPPTRE